MCCTAIAASGSPQGDFVKNILNARGARYSDNIVEDANLKAVSTYLPVFIKLFPKINP